MCSLIKLSSIKSFSSESQKYPAKNLLNQNDEVISSWKCNKWTDYCWIVLELFEESLIDSIIIVNECSAFIEIFSSSVFDISKSNFKVLLPVFSSQPPSDSRKNTNCAKKFSFISKHLTSAKNYPCKFIKCVCSQPYNKKINFGISSIKIYGSKCESQNKDEPLFKRFKLMDTPIIHDKFFQTNFDLVHKKQILNPNVENKQKINSNSQDNKESKDVYSDENNVTMASVTVSEIPKSTSGECTSLKVSKNNAKHNKSPKKNTRKSKPKPVSAAISSQYEASTSSKRKNTVNNDVKKKIKKPFEKLLSKVVFVLSGYKNPLRSELRDKAIAMGAKYEPEWNPNCTHLICAFENTPKYKEVSRLGGRIVSGKWIQDSYVQKKRLPWINYRLGSYNGKDGYNTDDDDDEEEEEEQNEDNNDENDETNSIDGTTNAYDSDIIYDLETEDDDEEMK